MGFCKYCLVLSVSLCLALNGLSVEAAKDVLAKHWAEDSVKELKDYKIMQGDPNGDFRGASKVTRYELAVALSNAMKVVSGQQNDDKQDLLNIVSLMEIFQKELGTIHHQNAELSNQVRELRSTIEQLQSDKADLIAKIENRDKDILDLQNKGFWYDTVIKGNAHDFKKLVQVGKNLKHGSTEAPEVNVEAQLQSPASNIEKPSS